MQNTVRKMSLLAQEAAPIQAKLMQDFVDHFITDINAQK
jgi:hypothetical protein